MKIESPIRLGAGLNDREHPIVRSKRVKKEKEAVGWLLRQFEKPPTPVTFTITRIAPGSGLDRDNLFGATKACRDAISEWIGVNDRDETTVSYAYAQERGPWGIRIAWADQGA